MAGNIRVVLLCAGEVGYRCTRGVLESNVAELVAIFTYQLEPPQERYKAHIEELGRQHGVPVFETANVGRGEYRGVWENLRPDYIFGMRWRTVVPQWVIDLSRYGLIIFHASLLPQYRGFTPISWALINGERKTGVTMFYATEEIDAGDIVDRREILITDVDDATSLDAKVAEMVEQMLVDNLPQLAEGTAQRIPQDHHQATYAIWRSPEDGQIDWDRPTRAIFNLIRGMTHPYSGAFTFLNGQKLTIWSAEIDSAPRRYVGSIPGKVERIIPGANVNVLTGDGILRLKNVQLAGDEPRNAAEVIKRLQTRLG